MPPASGASALPLVRTQSLHKRFGGVQALADISLSIATGSIHGLVGENGAGKSTLAKVIGGIYTPDSGELSVDGRPRHFSAPRDALAAGIATIAQELALVPTLSVVDNIFLGIEQQPFGVVRGAALRQRFDALNARTGFGLSADARVGRLRVAEQQKVEILRAIARDARLILMDEPTASLTSAETNQLLTIIRQLSAAGTTIVLVSHFLDQVLAVCDTVTIMRDGRIIRTGPASAETPESLVVDMIGRSFALAFPPKQPPPTSAPVVLEATGLRRDNAIDGVSLSIRRGEIVGLAGLVGSGRTEVARALFGADRLDGGTIAIAGKALRIRRPEDAMRAGIALLPESRKDQGLVMRRPIRENLTLANMASIARAGVVQGERERTMAGAIAKRMAVRTPSLELPVVRLSGGNQQKVLLGKWLLRQPRVLLADEPTRGVDVGAKREIYDLLVRLAEQGMAILLISSEIEELVGLAHRILVLRSGRLVASFEGSAITRDTVMRAAFQTGSPSQAEEGRR